MAQRKAPVRHFPMNYDPTRLNKARKKDKQDRPVCGMTRPRQSNVRMMLPMSIKCLSCRKYNYVGSKFNMRLQVAFNENYLGLQIYRFYFKCSSCFAQIAFKTDPKNYDYVVEAGGARTYDPLRDQQQAQYEIKANRQQKQEGNAMLSLQNRTYDSKREMQLMEIVEEIKEQNKRQATLTPQALLSSRRMLQHLTQIQVLPDQQQIQQEYDRLCMVKTHEEPQELQPQEERHQKTCNKISKLKIKKIIKRKIETDPIL